MISSFYIYSRFNSFFESLLVSFERIIILKKVVLVKFGSPSFDIIKLF